MALLNLGREGRGRGRLGGRMWWDGIKIGCG